MTDILRQGGPIGQVIVYTDSIEFGDSLRLPKFGRWETSGDRIMPELSERLFCRLPVYRCETGSGHEFRHMFAVKHARQSQYDLVVELCGAGAALPHGVLCLAGSGNGFHGQRNREWDSPPGNIYLTAYFAPCRRVEHFGPGFIILPAVSVLGAIDIIPAIKGRASTKWVNDILVDGAKVAGVLTYTQAMGSDITGVVLGIGLNVETSPAVRTDRFAPRVACLRDFSPNVPACSLPEVLHRLIGCLSANYMTLLDGGYHGLLELYRRRSAIIGKRVTIYGDDPGAEPRIPVSGKVESIGENLELRLEGCSKPVTRGRVMLEA